MLNHRHGKQSADGLRIAARGRAPAGVPVTVNGVSADRNGDRFTAEVVLRDKETDLIAVGEAGDVAAGVPPGGRDPPCPTTSPAAPPGPWPGRR